MKFVLVALLACLVLVQVDAGSWCWRRKNRNCVWSPWSSWCGCSNGVSTRTRYHAVTKRCSGRSCTGPSRETKCCGCGHGHEDGGRCICDTGWHGPICCLVDLDCGLHGHESGGRCICDPGWSGPTCRTRIRIGLDCGLHGHESGGRCTCDSGWRGSRCTINDCGIRHVRDLDTRLDKRSLPRPSICCGHGHESGGRCICDSGWGGSSCNEVIHLDCGLHGHESGVPVRCICDSGWGGSSCSIYEGIDDCGDRVKRRLPMPSICCGHGYESGGHCICDPGWRGPSCSIYMGEGGPMPIR